ncbi:MAG: 4Fe-4S dicluster domain-containing protein [Desulfurococcaceae archaeon]
MSGTIVQRSSGKFKVNVIFDRCKGCGICIEVCPTKVLVASNALNKYGFHPPEPANIDKCIGCRLCEYHCPDFVIFVEELKR